MFGDIEPGRREAALADMKAWQEQNPGLTPQDRVLAAHAEAVSSVSKKLARINKVWDEPDEP